MVASTITILPIYLDGRVKSILSGGVSSLEDDTSVHKSDSRTVSTIERSDRVLQSWQLSWSTASSFIVDLFRICRNSRGFLFISPLDDERVATAVLMRNTVTGLNVGDGSTTTFQLQLQTSLAYDVGMGTASSDLIDVNYPLNGTITAYKDGVSDTFTVDLLTGIVDFSSAPDVGVIPTATFEYAIASMFTSKSISRTLLQADQSEVRSAQIEAIL